jgi:hypothetical protein
MLPRVKSGFYLGAFMIPLRLVAPACTVRLVSLREGEGPRCFEGDKLRVSLFDLEDITSFCTPNIEASSSRSRNF